MSIAKQIEQTAITAFVSLIGHGEIFSRMLAEIKRTNETLPDATGAEKRHKVLADLEIIFDDLVVPVGESILRLLLELGVAYLKATVV